MYSSVPSRRAYTTSKVGPIALHRAPSLSCTFFPLHRFDNDLTDADMQCFCCEEADVRGT